MPGRPDPGRRPGDANGKRVTITLGLGMNKPKGRRVHLDTQDPVRSLARILAEHRGLEAWVCFSKLKGSYRKGRNWQETFLLGTDIDTPDHTPISEEQIAGVFALVHAGTIPASLLHVTPAGIRLVGLLNRAICSVEEFRLVASAYGRMVAALVKDLGLSVDSDASEDRVRAFFTPNSIAKGVQREAEVEVVRTEPFSVSDLIDGAPTPPKQTLSQAQPPDLSDADWGRIREALRYVSPESRETWLRIGMALHWTEDPRARQLWDEWSQGSPHKFDARVQDLTWASFKSERPGPVTTLGTLFKLAKDGGYQGVEVHGRPRIPDPVADPSVERDCLPLRLARERVADEIAHASLRGRSLDLSGSAGLGKSTAVIDDAIDTCTASNVSSGHPLILIAVGGGRELALERHRDVLRKVEEAGASDEINVALALGRQAPPDGSVVAPNGFNCRDQSNAARRMQQGFSGCSGCAHLRSCKGSDGEYLHDWSALKRLASSGPTIVVMTIASLATFWERIQRRGGEGQGRAG